MIHSPCRNMIRLLFFFTCLLYGTITTVQNAQAASTYATNNSGTGSASTLHNASATFSTNYACSTTGVLRGMVGGGSDIASTNFYFYDDVAGTVTPEVTLTYNDALSSFHGSNAYIDGLALDPNSGNFYAFVLDDSDTASLVPIAPLDLESESIRAQLVEIDPVAGTATPVDANAWLDGRGVTGAGFDATGRLWAIDIYNDQLIEVDLTTGMVVAGSTVDFGFDFGEDMGFGSDIAFTADGLGIIVQAPMEFYVFDTVLNIVYLLAPDSNYTGFDAATPPVGISGVAFTSDLTARNGDGAAQQCRVNLYDGRGTDELGHTNDPFTTNPLSTVSDLKFATGNAGAGDMATCVTPKCMFDYGDAPAGFGDASHNISPSLRLGNQVDADIGAQNAAPHETDALGDDSNGTDDEDGVTLGGLTTTSVTYSAEVTCAGSGTVAAWVDFDQSGTFDAGERQESACADTTVNISWSGLSNLITGTTYARFRFASAAGDVANPTGLALDGEVEDYAITITVGAPTITGPSEGSTITDTTPLIEGTAAPGDTVDVSQGGNVICTAIADANGDWSCTPATPLSEGPNAITATASNGTSTSPPSPERTFTIDTAVDAPTITGPSEGSTITDTTPLIEGTAEPGSTVEVSQGGNVICTATADANGDWSCTPATPLSEGPNAITATASNGTSTSSPSPERTFTIDTAVDAPAVTEPIDGSTITDTTPLIEGTAEPGSTVEVSQDGQVLCTATADANGDWSCTPSTPLSEGLNTIEVVTTDPAGNTSAATSVTFSISSPSSHKGYYLPFAALNCSPQIPCP